MWNQRKKTQMIIEMKVVCIQMGFHAIIKVIICQNLWKKPKPKLKWSL
jgi:hypothetical protein